jgi:hypothetical protein
MKSLFYDEQNNSKLIVGRERNNNISIHLNDDVFELNQHEAEILIRELAKYHREQVYVNEALLPWWRRFFR